MHDIPYSLMAIKRHAYVHVGVQRLGASDRIGLLWNGVIWVDRKSKDKSEAKRRMVECLENNEGVLMFPEATWNRTEAKPLHPLYWGCLDIARDANVPIVPVVLIYESESRCHIRFGSPFYPHNISDKENDIKQLEEQMSTILWNMWEAMGGYSRNDVSEEKWKADLQHRMGQLRTGDWEYEQSCVLTKVQKQ